MTNLFPKNYLDQIAYFEAQYDEIDGCAFYESIFPDNEDVGVLQDDFSRPNAIYLYTDPSDQGTERQMRRRIMLRDTWEEDYMTYVEGNEKTLCGGLSYRGRANKLNQAQACHAIVIDLDGVGMKEIRNLFLRFESGSENPWGCPLPTYLVSSGKGLHIYYVFDQPIDLFPNIKLQLKGLKHDLTRKLWDYKSTSQFRKVQYQSINQGFRMVGSINSKYGTPVRAFKVGEKVTIDYLNSFVSSKVDLQKRFRPSKMTREQAKIKFPDWYNRNFDATGNKCKNPKRGKWDIAGKVNGDDPYALYHWWIRKAAFVTGGHRYFFLMCMSIYACKCDVPKKKLREDMEAVFEQLKQIEHDNELSQVDVKSAIEAFSKEYWNFTIDDISKITDIRIEKNKRNGRKRKDHIKLMNYIRDEINGNKEWRNKDGRPTAELHVAEWRRSHPDGRKVDCIRDTGLSKPTVLKWWEQ